MPIANEIIAAATGAGGSVGVMYLWVRDLQNQRKKRDEKDAARDTVLLEIIKEQTALATTIRDRLKRIEYAVSLRQRQSHAPPPLDDMDNDGLF